MGEAHIIGTVFYFGAGAGFVYAVYRFLRYRSLAVYRPVTGTVVRSEIVEDRGGGNMPMYVAKIEYEYEVRRRAYTGKVINGGGDIWTSSRSRTQAIQSRYRTRREVEVRYDPTNPARCYLERSLTPLVSGIVAAVGLSLLGAFLRAW